MKQIFIAGNWKSNKLVHNALTWIEKFTSEEINDNSSTVVIASPYTALYPLKQYLDSHNLSLELAAQNISAFSDGAYTGEICASMIKELATWVIIGHSERRKHMGETDEVLEHKVNQAKSVGLKIIFCVPDKDTTIPKDVDVVAYEPVWAIGTGKTDTPEHANKIIESIKKKYDINTVIYGGSVKPDNVHSFISQPHIDGVLPGGASLDPHVFVKLIHNATKA